MGSGEAYKGRADEGVGEMINTKNSFLKLYVNRLPCKLSKRIHIKEIDWGCSTCRVRHLSEARGCQMKGLMPGQEHLTLSPW